MVSKENLKGKIDEEKEDLNELPYNKALSKDKRNIFQIFYSLLIQRMDLINILFIPGDEFKLIIISQYISSLLVNFFFNALLFSTEVISYKYHNNGELDFLLTLLLSIISNIITSVIIFYSSYSKKIVEKFDLIKDIKKILYYFLNLFHYYKFVNRYFVFFLVRQTGIICCCYYYIVIFFIIYTCSKNSLLTNYFTSLIEGLIVSLAVTLIISITRKIGLMYLNKRLYILSNYINKNF